MRTASPSTLRWILSRVSRLESSAALPHGNGRSISCRERAGVKSQGLRLCGDGVGHPAQAVGDGVHLLEFFLEDIAKKEPQRIEGLIL